MRILSVDIERKFESKTIAILNDVVANISNTYVEKLMKYKNLEMRKIANFVPDIKSYQIQNVSCFT